MTKSPSPWDDLRQDLARRRVTGRPARFWLRDDDAVAPTAALDWLLALCRRYQVPLALAVIPAHAEMALVERLSGEALASVVVHGWAHQNHAPVGQKKQELGLHRSRAVVEAEVAKALTGLKTLFGQKLVPVLVPPWNRIDPALVPKLSTLGYSGLSTFGPAKPAPLPIVNATVDIIDWHGTRGCRDQGKLVAEIVAQLNDDLKSGQGRPVGILTHHLVHDEAAWGFLDRLFSVCTTASGSEWMAIEDVLKSASR